jgi:hypothetical protein
MRQMNCGGRATKTVAPDDLTVWVRTPSVYSTLSLNQDRDVPRRSLQHRMNRRLSQGEASVYPTVTWKLPETFWPRGLQHRMNRRTVGVMCRSSCVSESSTAKWRRGHRMNRCYLFQWPLANGSLDAYLYPLHSPIWGCWIVWKCRRVQDT